MKKVKVNLKINDYELDTFGFLNNDILSFYDKDKEKTNIIYSYRDNTLIRDNDSLLIKIFFNKEKDNISYELKKEKMTFLHNFTNFSLKNIDGAVIINYRIEDTDFRLVLSYEEV